MRSLMDRRNPCERLAVELQPMRTPATGERAMTEPIPEAPAMQSPKSTDLEPGAVRQDDKANAEGTQP